MHASFFIIGESAQANPNLVRRILAEGHDIGNHTFTHPNLGDLPDSLVSLQINANQRLFEALTGRSMRLFRAPFLGDAEPTTSDEIVPLQIAQSMGYVTVGLQVDPNDWLRPPADTIVNRVIEQVTDPSPEISVTSSCCTIQAAIARKRSRPCPRSSMASGPRAMTSCRCRSSPGSARTKPCRRFRRSPMPSFSACRYS